ncbi:MAG: TolC family protein [Bacteroidota bacterium]
MNKIWFLFFITLAAFSFAQDPEVVTLKALVRSKLLHSPVLENFSNQQQIERLKKQEEWTDLKPQIKLNSSYYYYFFDVPEYIFNEDQASILSFQRSIDQLGVPVGTDFNFTASLQFSQRIFDTRLLGSKELFGKGADLQLLFMEEKKSEEIHKISKDYINYLSLSQKEKSIQFNKGRLDKLYAIVLKRIELGMAGDVDSARLAKAVKLLELDERKLANGKQMLKTSLIAYSEIDAKLPFDTTHLYSTFLPVENDNTEINKSDRKKLLEASIELYNYQSKHVSTLNPKLDFFGDLFWRSQSTNANIINDGFWNNASLLGLKLNFPIYSGGKSSLQRQQLFLRKEIAQNRLSQLTKGEKQMNEKLNEEISYAKKKYDLELEWQIALRKQLLIAKTEWEQGVSSIKDLLEAEEELLSSEKVAVQLLAEIRLKELEYLKTTGQLRVILD